MKLDTILTLGPQDKESLRWLGDASAQRHRSPVLHQQARFWEPASRPGHFQLGCVVDQVVEGVEAHFTESKVLLRYYDI